MFDAVVLAGGGKREPLTEQEGVNNKAFIKIYGREILAYILESLEKAPSINRIVVVGPEDDLRQLQKDGYRFDLALEQGSMLNNIAAGLEKTEQGKLSLIVTGDIPLLTDAVVERFIKSCSPHQCDLYYPVIRKSSFEKGLPGSVRTYVRLLEGQVTGGNIGLVSPAWFFANRNRLEMFIAYRKKPVKLARILSPVLVLKFLFKRLSISDLESFLSRLLNLKACAVISEDIEIGVDVDKVSDLSLIKEALKPD